MTAFVILGDGTTYGAADDSDVLLVTDEGALAYANGGDEDAAERLLTDADQAIRVSSLLEVFAAAEALTQAEPDEDGLPISEDFLAKLDALHVALYGKAKNSL